jgi:hypothetical protein
MPLKDHSDIPDHDVDYLSERVAIGLPTQAGRLAEAHLPAAERRGIYEPITEFTITRAHQVTTQPAAPRRSWIGRLLYWKRDPAESIIAAQPEAERRQIEAINRQLATNG